jgi:hypothetical protein
MTPCPLCGSEMEKEAEGVISELIMRNGGAIERVARPAVWYGCTGCEHCEEVGRG